MVRLLSILLLFFQTDVSDTCPDKLVTQIFKPNYNSNYLLCLPVEIDGKQARIVIEKKDFVKYMVTIDSSFVNIDKLKDSTIKILKGSKVFYFSKIVYKQKVGSSGYRILYDKNRLSDDARKNKYIFLKKYLLNFNLQETNFNFDTGNPSSDFYLAVEILFKMNYLTSFSDGTVNVSRVVCE